MCNCVDVILSGRFDVLTAGESLRFRLFVCWYLILASQVLSVRKISVADSYCNVVVFFASLLRSFLCTFVGSRVISFVY